MSFYKNFEEKEIKNKGVLYVVSTPIGNINDITQRALMTLRDVNIIVVENIYRTKHLLQYFNIKKRLLTLNNFNEKLKTKLILAKLLKGQDIALVSNSGTPLINDPGFCLVRDCYKFGVRVVPLPGPCAAIAALSVAGISTNRFCYEGFLPNKSNSRRNTLRLLAQETRTLIFYESTHRVLSTLRDMILELGEERYVVLAREITKFWESIYGAPIGKLLNWILEDKNRCRGEIVILVSGIKRTKS